MKSMIGDRKQLINIVTSYKTRGDVEVRFEASQFAKDDIVYFVPDGVLLQNTVPAEDYNRLKRLMKEKSGTFWSRLRFLFRGWK